jgi:hypothetical protein
VPAGDRFRLGAGQRQRRRRGAAAVLAERVADFAFVDVGRDANMGDAGVLQDLMAAPAGGGENDVGVSGQADCSLRRL